MQKIGMIGSGTAAHRHADCYASMDTATVTAVTTPIESTESTTVHSRTAEAFDDGEELCASADVDAVDICTPFDHDRWIETAAEHGLDVFCEPPLARTFTAAETITETVKQDNIAVSTGHYVRFLRPYAEARRRVTDGRIGTPGIVRMSRSASCPLPTDNSSDADSTGDALLDLTIHEFDYLRWLLGDVERVFARTRRRDEFETVLTILRFETGAIAHVDTTWSRTRTETHSLEFEIAGDDGLIEFDDSMAHGGVFLDDTHDTARGDGLVDTIEKNGYRRALEQFVSSSATDESPAVTVDDAVGALRIGLAARRSADRGVPVEPTEVNPDL